MTLVATKEGEATFFPPSTAHRACRPGPAHGVINAAEPFSSLFPLHLTPVASLFTTCCFDIYVIVRYLQNYLLSLIPYVEIHLETVNIYIPSFLFLLD